MCGIWAIFGIDGDIADEFNKFMKIRHRGPDSTRFENVNIFKKCYIGFQRLMINDQFEGMQPMRLHKFPHIWLMCNGEIYNCHMLADEFGFEYDTKCDIEAIIHLYCHGGIEFAAQHLDGVFSFCLMDTSTKKVYIVRDTYGVRPSYKLENTKDGTLSICSEAKGLMYLSEHTGDNFDQIRHITPGHIEIYDIADDGKATFCEMFQFNKPGQTPIYKTPINTLDEDISTNIRHLLETAVRKRLLSDRRIGCLLSGGLDSSLIASMVAKYLPEHDSSYKLQTFSIGMEGSPDLMAARKVAHHIGTEHHEVIFTAEEGVEAIRDVIYHLETYDITTIRASVGMYLVSKYISKNTDTIVVYSGEGADELAQGYIYFHKAPSAEEADKESHRLLQDLYMYDVLRGDRTTAAWGLELRVPFLDHQFTSYILSLSSELRQPTKGIEKYLLRKAFDGTGLIPDEILWRAKEAFSDGVSSHKKSWYEILQEHVASQINDDMLATAKQKYQHLPPKTKEAYFYRQTFEEYFPGQAEVIPYYWMPRWIEADDPSARTLKHYKS